MRIEPTHGKGYEFAWEVVGGSVSSSYQTSIEKGVKSVMEGGAIAGYPIVDVKVAITDGKEHAVDSEADGLRNCRREALQEGHATASPVLLEPIMKVSVVVPEHNMGDVLGDINTKRARARHGSVCGQERRHRVRAAGRNAALRGRPALDHAGRGIFSMEFDHYEEVPAHVAQGIIEQAQKDHPNLRLADSD